MTVMVPHYATSGGTLLALATDEILLAPSPSGGPVDPQVGQQPAASILTVPERKEVNKIDDETLVVAVMSRKAMTQVRETVRALLVGNGMKAEAADELALTLSEGRWAHDYPITADMAKDFDLPISTDLPDGVRDVIRLYPRPRGRRPSVEYIPLPYRQPRGDAGRR